MVLKEKGMKERKKLGDSCWRSWDQRTGIRRLNGSLKNDSFVSRYSQSGYCRLSYKMSKAEGELGFVKNDMPGRDDTAALEIQASITAMVGRIAEKHAGHRSWA